MNEEEGYDNVDYWVGRFTPFPVKDMEEFLPVWLSYTNRRDSVCSTLVNYPTKTENFCYGVDCSTCPFRNDESVWNEALPILDSILNKARTLGRKEE